MNSQFRYTALAVLILISGCAQYQGARNTNNFSYFTAEEIEPSLAASDSICNASLCRSSGDQGNLQILPYVYKDKIFLLPNEKLLLDGNWSNDSLKNIRRLPDSTGGGRLFLEFTIDSSAVCMLKVVNPYPGMIKYHALMRLSGQNIYIATTTCPVLSNGGSGFETWNDAIEAIVIYGITYLKNNKNRACTK